MTDHTTQTTTEALIAELMAALEAETKVGGDMDWQERVLIRQDSQEALQKARDAGFGGAS